MEPIAACTIASNNYLALVRVLARTYREHHPGAPFFACIVDEPDPSIDYDNLPFPVIFARSLEIPRFANAAFRYNLLEFNTAVKPFLLRHLRDVFQLDRVFYFDPDILVCNRLTALEEALRTHQAVLTPHITSPLDNQRSPTEIRIRSCGVYNLGFLGLSLDESTRPFLDWWADRLLDYCYSDLQAGLFVDQAWMEYAPAFLDRVGVIREPEFNIAYWNLPHRELTHTDSGWLVNQRPVGFVHFSGVDFEEVESISRYQDRLTMADRPELRPLFEGYREATLAEGHGELEDLPYAFGFFTNGVAVGYAARRALQEIDPYGERWPDPFDTEGEDTFFSWLKESVACPGGTLTRAAEIVWKHRIDIQSVFPDFHDRDLRRFQEWLLTRPEEELLGFEIVFFEGVALDLAAEPPQNETTGSAESSQQPRGPEAESSKRLVIPASSQSCPGVHVYGYVRAESGVGEHTRLLVESLRAAGISYAVHPWRATESRLDHPFDDLGSRDATGYPVNIVGVNADVFPEFVRVFGRPVVEDRYTVALWAWELEEFPEWMAESAALVDEIWANSTFSAAAIARAVDIPVHAFSLPVRPPDNTADGAAARARFGLDGRFTFLFTFDFQSIFERKNPIAVIRAFRRAFRPSEPAVLVIKSVNGYRHREAFRALAEAIGDHPHIILHDAYLPANEQVDLMHGCDAYVSLHRAEGFGLTLAEAMALGKPVIATGYSGNRDFMTAENSYLVPFSLTRVPAGCAPYPAGACWAEPDVDAAAAAMREVFDNREQARDRGLRGQREVLAHHSVTARSAFLSHRLEAIHQGLANGLLDPRSKLPKPLAVDAPTAVTNPVREPETELATQMEEVSALVTHGPNPTLPGRLGPLSKLMRRLLLRIIRHYDIHQREVTGSLVALVQRLEERSREDSAAVHAELETLRRRRSANR